MKVVLFITGLGMGGAENLVVNLADNYSNKGYDVTIIYAFKEQLVFPKNKNIDIFSLGVTTYWDFVSACYHFRTIVNRIKPDVVHSHMFHANILARLMKPFCKYRRLINTAHSTNEGGRFRMFLYRVTDSLSDMMTNVSQEAVDVFIHKGAAKAKKIIAVENGIDTNEFTFSKNIRDAYRAQLHLSNDDKLILAIGSLRAAKDYPNLLNALALLKDKHENIKLIIIGDGPLKYDLGCLVDKLKLGDIVEFLGVRYDIPEFLSACDVFVLSSYYEGFGLVVAEAMSCERAVVATDCGGVKEVVGTCGILVEKSNYNELANLLSQAIELSDTALEKIGVDSRNRIINNFSIESTANNYIELYKRDF
ncbi:glycosyltransferase [Photobacterium sanguinicancri]|uniref:Glycosyltransferase n=1 Tax=Photobacterium sanguinicancri TaxID=875932 RepID=A0AAW7Y4T3_9GAMM|nr:glycosyltransferase [Photobacterium sanguinicancri]MDO6542474.1 glycosyltransferase [Photobacterium sanguinicancri]